LNLLYFFSTSSSHPAKLSVFFDCFIRSKRRTSASCTTACVDFQSFSIVSEWRTNGIVYSKVLGSKKSYSFKLPLPPILLCDGQRCRSLEPEFPTFSVAMDFVSLLVEKERKRVRRFWEREGKIDIYLVIERLRTKPVKKDKVKLVKELKRKSFKIEKVEAELARELRASFLKIEKVKLGEIKVRWVGHRAVDDLASRRVRRLKKMIKELKEKNEALKNLSVKLSVSSRIKKLEEGLRKELAKSRKQLAAGLMISGNVGGVSIKKLVVFSRKREVKVPVSQLRETQLDNDRWGIMLVDDEEKLKALLKGKKFIATFVLKDETKIRGLSGWMNHVIRVVSIPQRKAEVATLAQVRENVWRNLVKVNKHPVKVSEYLDEEKYVKYWVLEPIDNVARVLINNKDHAGEGLDRILCQVKKGEYVVFWHEL